VTLKKSLKKKLIYEGSANASCFHLEFFSARVRSLRVID
jgi:hypothetical protein